MTQKKGKNRSGEIALSIRNKIISGELASGERLIEQDIATEFSVSRGPVREALQELEHEGLIVSEVNKGSTVARLSGEDAYEIFYLRGSLEKIALEKCGGTLLDSSLLEMRSLIDDMKYEEAHENRLHVLIDYDERFHREILVSGRMNRLLLLWQSLSPLNSAMFLKVEHYYKALEEMAEARGKLMPKKYRKTVSELHQEIFDVLVQGDLEKSVAITEIHYYNTGTMLFRWESRKDEEDYWEHEIAMKKQQGQSRSVF